MVSSNLAITQAELEEICQRYGVQRLALFGSVLSDRFGPDSDVDVLVEFAAGRVPGLGFITLQEELSALFGREVDLHTYKSLSRYFRDDVSKEAEVQYESAA